MLLKKYENDSVIFGEFANPQDGWEEATSSEIKAHNKRKLAENLIKSRKDYLGNTDFRVLRFIDEGAPYPDEIKTKRTQARREIKEIEACTTLTALNQFNEVFE